MQYHAQARSYAEAYEGALQAIDNFAKPTISLIKGACTGGGCELASVTDIRIAADNARFGQTGPKVGSFDGGFGSSYLARIVGQKKAREIWFLCRQYDAQQALDMAGVGAEDIDLIIIATTTPDKVFPATACIVQRRLGIRGCGAFDVQAACSGFVYGLDLADRYIRTGAGKNVLVIGAETMSSLTNWEDRTTAVLFGDGAGAVVLEPASEPRSTPNAPCRSSALSMPMLPCSPSGPVFAPSTSRAPASRTILSACPISA